MRLGRWILVGWLGTVAGVVWCDRAVAGEEPAAGEVAPEPEALTEQQPLLGAAAAAQTARAALALAGAATDPAARRALVGHAQSEGKRLRKVLAQAVDRARQGGEKRRAAELGRLNVELSRLVREVDAASAGGEPDAIRAALAAAEARAAGLADALAGLDGAPARRALGLALWRAAATEGAERGALAGALGVALLAALEATEPKADAELIRRCRAALAAVGARSPAPDVAAWAALARVAAEVTRP